MNKFRINIVARIILIVAFILAGIALLYNKRFLITPIFFFLIAIYITSSLFKYIDKINRDLKRFLTSIKYSDYTQSYFSKNFGSAYGDLYKTVSSTYNEISTYRIQAEENLQYLKTLIELVPSGIIAYKENGEVELINQAAKRILNTQVLTNINSVKEEKHNVKHLLENIEIGKEKVVKLSNGGKEKTISVYASSFKQRNQLYTLITLKDMENELEKERLENELNIAQNVQSSLLPQKTPEFKNYEISVLFKPAKRVGGDFYDFFELSKNKFGIIIGDVSGKGLGAAIYTTLIKGIFQTLAFESSSTAEVLKKANSLIYQMLDRKSFITAIYGILDMENNTLSFSRAGHEPLLFFENEKNDFKFYRQSGLGLGLEKGKILSSNLDEQVISFDLNDSVMFYTDGLVDLKNNSGVDNSLENFKEIVKTNYAKGPGYIIAKFENEINDYTEQYEQFDDITTIIVKRKF